MEAPAAACCATRASAHSRFCFSNAFLLPGGQAARRPGRAVARRSEGPVPGAAPFSPSPGASAAPPPTRPAPPPHRPRRMLSLPVSAAVWGLILAVPLVFTWNSNYEKVFPAQWYDTAPTDYYGKDYWPSPLGLSLGLLAVVVGQVFVLVYFVNWKRGRLGDLQVIQKEGAPAYDIWEGMRVHLAQPEGFVMLGGYLILTWMFGLMPASYYSFTGGINVWHVLLQLLIQDFIQATIHWIEHKVSSEFYKVSHKPHHRFTNPKLFDAFNGSVLDTLCMILVPLALTARIVPANVWSYMAFGSLYANWLTLIHSEYVQPWDGVFRKLGLGTAADHHVHHKLFIYNYGHLFMYWDYLFGTYKNPSIVREFNKDV